MSLNYNRIRLSRAIMLTYRHCSTSNTTTSKLFLLVDFYSPPFAQCASQFRSQKWLVKLASGGQSDQHVLQNADTESVVDRVRKRPVHGRMQSLVAAKPLGLATRRPFL